MPKTYNIEPVRQAFSTAKQTLILLPQNPDLDAVAAGLSLYLALTKKQVNVSIGCPTPMTVQFNRLFGVDKIKPRIGNQNLVISFQYPEDSLEKVSYDKDPANQRFNLTIEPKAGMQPLDTTSVEYSYTGSSADIIFVIGARQLEDLGDLYKSEQKLLDDKTKILVNLSSLDRNAQFGTVNLYDPTVSATCEIVFTVINDLGLALESDIATNLLAGIEAKTANFTSPQTTADTFEMVAQLLRFGAKKGQMTTPFSRPLNPLTRPAANPWALPNNPVKAATPPDWLKPKVLTSSSQI
ncbi:MAG: hypothetical protein NTZ93_03805 [Candidatus Beckwithbacteria bacterium]|nr:hypothetical protein [Candidatus Beckwithbacteria bacterium]